MTDPTETCHENLYKILSFPVNTQPTFVYTANFPAQWLVARRRSMSEIDNRTFTFNDHLSHLLSFSLSLSLPLPIRSFQPFSLL